jgi:hypothetical protein
MPFAALHESVHGTFRTWRDVRVEFAMRFKADVAKSNIAAAQGASRARLEILNQQRNGPNAGKH